MLRNDFNLICMHEILLDLYCRINSKSNLTAFRLYLGFKIYLRFNYLDHDGLWYDWTLKTVYIRCFKRMSIENLVREDNLTSFWALCLICVLEVGWSVLNCNRKYFAELLKIWNTKCTLNYNCMNLFSHNNYFDFWIIVIWPSYS